MSEATLNGSHRTLAELARGACGYAAVLLALRVVFLCAALDPQEERTQSYLDAGGVEWTRGPERPLYDREELYTGAAAEAMRLNLPLPVDVYRFMPYGSGSLLVSLVARPLFTLLGPTYLAFKVLPLLVTLAGGLFWFSIIRKWVGRSAAWGFGCLYLFAPPVLVRTALISKGDHPEAMAWVGGTLLLATHACFAASGRRRLCFAAGAGLAAGLGVSLSYSTLPVLAGVGVAALLMTRFRPRSAWLAVAIALAVGLVPWLFTVGSTGGSALRVYDRPLGALTSAGEIGARLRLLLTQGILAGYDLPGGLVIRRLAAMIWLAAVVGGWFRLSGRLGRGRSTAFAPLVLVGTGAALLAFLLTAPDASSRYLVPVYPLLLISVASLLEPRVAREGRRERVRGIGFSPSVWGRSLAALVLILGACAQLSALGSSHFLSLVSPLKGYDWPLLGEVLGTKLSPEGVLACPESVRPFLWVGVGRRLARTSPPAAWAQAAGEAGPDNAAVWKGIGIGLAEGARFEEAAAVLRQLPAPSREAMRAGLCLYGEVIFVPLLRADAEALGGWFRGFEWEDQEALRRALARTLAVLELESSELRPRVERAVTLVSPDDAAYGAGWACYAGWSRNGTLRVRRGNGWVAQMARDAGGRDTSAFWEGVSAAWQADLSLRSSGWILGGESGPVELARALERVTRVMGDGRALYFAAAASKAARDAWMDPSRRDQDGLGFARWRTLLPDRLHARFADGLEERAE